MKNYLNLIKTTLLFWLLLSCDSYMEKSSRRQLELFMQQSSDLNRSTSYRLDKFIQLKEKMFNTPKEDHKALEEYVEKNREFFYKLLFDLKPKELLYNDTDEIIFKLASYGYLPKEEIFITDDKVYAFTDIPRKKEAIDDLKTEIEYGDNNRILLPTETKILISDTLKILDDNWLVLTFNDTKAFVHPNALIGTSKLADEHKAKAIWLTVQYFKNYKKDSNSYRMISFLVNEFDINTNRKLMAGFTFLHYAVQRGDNPLFYTEYLLSRNADINEADTNGNTPLDYAMQSTAILSFPHPEKYSPKQIEEWKQKRKDLKITFINTLIAKGAKSGKSQ